MIVENFFILLVRGHMALLKHNSLQFMLIKGPGSCFTCKTACLSGTVSKQVKVS